MSGSLNERADPRQAEDVTSRGARFVRENDQLCAGVELGHGAIERGFAGLVIGLIATALGCLALAHSRRTT